MNSKLLFKTIFLILVALLLVLMGMNNKGDVKLFLPPLLSKGFSQPAAIMYVGSSGWVFSAAPSSTPAAAKRAAASQRGLAPRFRQCAPLRRVRALSGEAAAHLPPVGNDALHDRARHLLPVGRVVYPP